MGVTNSAALTRHRRSTGQASKRLVKLPQGDTGGCWLWQGQFRGSVPLKTWFNRQINARRWLWEMIIGPVSTNHRLFAKCGDYRCVNPAHMRVVTMAEAAVLHLSNLVPGDVDEVKALYAEGKGPVAISRETGHSIDAVRNILYAKANRAKRKQRAKQNESAQTDER